MRIYLLLVFTALLFPAAHSQVRDTLMWSDEFDGNGPPDPAYWSYDIGAGGWGNNEVQIYTNLYQNCHQQDGSLFITALKQGYAWTSARIITSNKFNFTYGRVVFRAKLPEGSGTWPALWMLGQNFASAGWPGCGEIDVMEHVGKDPGLVHSSLHSPSSYGNTVNTGVEFVPNVSTEFHTYQAYWTPEKIEFSIDSVPFYTYHPAVQNNQTWPFNKPFFLIMNIAMGGNMGSDPQYETGGLKNGIDPTLTQAQMEIDYVRVYRFSYPAGTDDKTRKDNGGIYLSPNPSHGKVRIDNATRHNAEGTIFNLVGNEVYRFEAGSPMTELDLSFLPRGLYILSLTSDGETMVQKVVLD